MEKGIGNRKKGKGTMKYTNRPKFIPSEVEGPKAHSLVNILQKFLPDATISPQKLS
jgi:hypothetical protein